MIVDSGRLSTASARAPVVAVTLSRYLRAQSQSAHPAPLSLITIRKNSSDVEQQPRISRKQQRALSAPEWLRRGPFVRRAFIYDEHPKWILTISVITSFPSP
jgi:hypothetical protein